MSELKPKKIVEEVRVTSETGGAKGQKNAQVSLIPVESLENLATLYAMGAKKYDRNNWRAGYNWSLSYDAMQRHAMKFWAGENADPEMSEMAGEPVSHMSCVAFHALSLAYFAMYPEKYSNFDDRYIQGEIDV